MPKERIDCMFCGFAVESERDEELMKVIYDHNESYHQDKYVSDQELRNRVMAISDNDDKFDY